MELKKTITTMFIVPTLKISRETLINNGFLNAYIKDEGRDVEYENSVLLLFQSKNLDQFREFLDFEYERTTQIIDDYDYANGFVVVVYQLDVNFLSDFELIKQGKYSKTSQAFQKLFPRVIKIIKDGLHRDEISLQYRVFNRTQDLITFQEERCGVTFDAIQEVWSGFVQENEILNMNKIKEYV